MKYKLLFLGQSLIFTMAAYIRTKDVERAQQLKKFAEDERQKVEGSAENEGDR